VQIRTGEASGLSMTDYVQCGLARVANGGILAASMDKQTWTERIPRSSERSCTATLSAVNPASTCGKKKRQCPPLTAECHAHSTQIPRCLRQCFYTKEAGGIVEISSHQLLLDPEPSVGGVEATGREVEPGRPCARTRTRMIAVAGPGPPEASIGASLCRAQVHAREKPA
jgi:hypothetical protein